MFRNYLKIAIRNLQKNRIFSVINILGLAIGLASFLLIAMFVGDEMSYDKFYKNSDRIYRVNSKIQIGDYKLNIAESSDMMGQVLKKDYPQVEAFTRIYNNDGSKLIRKGDLFMNEESVAHVDSTFFQIFQIPVIHGDLKHALSHPNSVVMTHAAAERYFGTDDAVGKNIETNDDSSTIYNVTAVIRDFPENSHMGFDFLFSMQNVDYPWGTFLSHNFHTYLLLKKGSDYHQLENQFPAYINKYALPEAKKVMQISSMEDFYKSGNKLEYSLSPLTKIHLHSNQSFEIKPSGNIQYVYIFSAIAIFILILACINFMNLTTARSAKRAREVGIRKVLGTGRKSLVAQFLSESLFTVYLSLFLALILVFLALPEFNDIAGKQLSIRNLFSPTALILILMLPLVVGIVAGSYPAFFLSAFTPVKVLKGPIAKSGHGRLRSFLVVFQFTIAIILIISTMVVFNQLHFIQNKNLGYNKDQVLIIDHAYSLQENVQPFKQAMLQQAGVVSGTVSSYIPVANASRSDFSYSKETVGTPGNTFSMQRWRVDSDYLKTMGMQLKEGRNFSSEFATDSNAVILNESAARFLGYANPLGKKIFRLDSIPVSYTIIGVVKDFNYESLRKEILPLGLFLGKSTGLVSFKVQAAKIPSLIALARAEWKKMAPEMPFSYRFMDDSFNEMYKSESRVGQLSVIFAGLSIFIAALGLFGLSAFMAEQRTKEIGVRKVLGASIQNIVRLLSKEFIVLVLIAFVIAAPVSWWAMNNWLQDFAYRAEMSQWIFIAAGMVALLIALLTISFQAIRAAMADPVKSLRTE